LTQNYKAPAQASFLVLVFFFETRADHNQLLTRKETKSAKALWDTDRGSEEKAKHGVKRQRASASLSPLLLTRFRFFPGAVQSSPQGVSQEATAIRLFPRHI
jgi:hypothetical protein